MFVAKFKRVKFRRKLTPLEAFNLLLDIEAGGIPKVLAEKYGISRAAVSWYRRNYFTQKLVRNAVEWPYIGKVPYYLRKKITSQ